MDDLHENENTDATSESGFQSMDTLEEFKRMLNLRQNLEKARLLCDMVQRREVLKKKHIEATEDVIYFKLNQQACPDESSSHIDNSSPSINNCHSFGSEVSGFKQDGVEKQHHSCHGIENCDILSGDVSGAENKRVDHQIYSGDPINNDCNIVNGPLPGVDQDGSDHQVYSACSQVFIFTLFMQNNFVDHG